jgi:hypothetical protein
MEVAMPLAKIVHLVDPKHQLLQAELIQEWSHPRREASEPIIIEDRQGQQGPVHVYVIWQDWSGLDQIERSEIIMSACEQARGADFALGVTVAMGLTVREAERMRIAYAPLEPAA